MITDVTGVLLAGGKSRRMGQDKRFLLVGERTLLDRSLAVLRSVFKNVCIVIAQDSASLEAEVPVLRDLIPDCGSLGGLYTGLREAVTPYVFVVACDMPFLVATTIEYVTLLKDQADIVMVRRASGLQPMHALYGKRCLDVMEEMIKARDLKIQNIVTHPSLRVKFVSEADLGRIDPDGRSFLNVNTPSDLDAVRILLERPADSGASS